MSELVVLDAPSGGQIGYRTFGTEGGWLVLIHGWCGSADHWDLIAPQLAHAHRLLVVSHPGFGGMAPPPRAGRTIEAIGSAVAKVLDHLDIRTATLVGHSMGGPIAVETAIATPERVCGLLGLDTLSDRGYYGRVPDEEIARRRRHFAADYGANMRTMVDAIVHPTTTDEMRAKLSRGMLAAASADFALDINEALFAWSAEERWPLVACSKMLLNSPHVAKLADPEPMPCFVATEIDTYDSGHFPMIEAPAMIVEKIKSCLARLA
jgi:pimeloyl-ACP methyl ester carboxylesterase